MNLFDRSLLPGDVVKRMNVEGSQCGIVCNSRVNLAFRIIGTKQVITGASSMEVIESVDLHEDILFYYRNWIGIIEDVKCLVTLSIPGGTFVKMLDSELLDFKDITSERSRNSQFDDMGPYVGQQLVAPVHLLPKFFFKKKPRDAWFQERIIMTVVQISVESVQAHWLCCIASGQDKVSDEGTGFILDAKPPRSIIDGLDLQDIVQLDYFKQGSIEMGDRGIYRVKDVSSIMTYSEWCRDKADSLRNHKLGLDSIKPSSACGDDDDFVDVTSDDSRSNLSFEIRYRKKLSVSIRRIRSKYLKPAKNCCFSRKPIPIVVGSKVPVEVVATNTIVNILWQDGSVERECPSTDFFPIHHLDGHEYFPGDFVVESKREFNHDLYGVVQHVDHDERTAQIKWFKVHGNQKPEFVSEQEVSVYDLEDHPDFNFRPGSCVARLSSVVTDSLSPAARAGQVVSLKTSGVIECVWADGSRCDVDPQDLYLLGDYDDDDLWADDDDDNSDESEHDFSPRSREPKTPPSTLSGAPSTPKVTGNNRELVDRLRKSVDGLEDWFNQFSTLNNQNGHHVVRKLTLLLENMEAVDAQMNTSLTNLKEVQTLIESVRLPDNISGRSAHINRKLNKLIKSILKKGTRSPLEGEESEEMVCEGVASEVNASPISTKTRPSLEILQKLKAQLFSACPCSDNGIEGNDVDAIAVSEEASASNPSFQHVDHVPDTHKFKLSILQVANPRPFFTRVKKEIHLLQTSLPKDILVKGFEDRMDLFSVLIKGPTGTPYEDGLFLFDVQLPAGYPNVPPLVHYITFCRDRLNPNLYESGKVCVSLLGTWSGKGSEVWSPVESTLLQLFISIQGLILVPEPYFNEAGYTRQKGTSSGDENSRLYNEMAVVKVVESMTRMISSPPEPFRDEIVCHVTSTSGPFISRLELWIKASKSPEAMAELKPLDFPLLPASKGFCLSLVSALRAFRSALTALK